jgi:hypothetical protein
MTVWHASCTCKMGKIDDPDAVVDSKAKVIGVTGLRVVDASSFALLPPGHPQVRRSLLLCWNVTNKLIRVRYTRWQRRLPMISSAVARSHVRNGWNGFSTSSALADW